MHKTKDTHTHTNTHSDVLVYYELHEVFEEKKNKKYKWRQTDKNTKHITTSQQNKRIQKRKKKKKFAV